MQNHNYLKEPTLSMPLKKSRKCFQSLVSFSFFLIALSNVFAQESQLNASSIQALGDLNNNGRPNFVAIQNSGNSNEVIVFEYDETNNKSILWRKNQNASSRKWVDVKVGDLNLNGKPEIIIISQNISSGTTKSNDAWLWGFEWDSNTNTFNQIISRNNIIAGKTIPNPKELLILDIDNDQTQEIVIYSGFPAPSLLIGRVDNLGNIDNISWQMNKAPQAMSENPAAIRLITYKQNMVNRVALVQKQGNRLLIAYASNNVKTLDKIRFYDLLNSDSFEIFSCFATHFSEENGLTLFAGTNLGNIYTLSEKLKTVSLWKNVSSPVKAIFINDYNQNELAEIFIQLNLSNIYLEQTSGELTFDSWKNLRLVQNDFQDMRLHPAITQHYIFEDEKDDFISSDTTASKALETKTEENVVEEVSINEKPIEAIPIAETLSVPSPDVPVLERKTHEKKPTETKIPDLVLHVGETFSHGLPTQNILEPSEAGLQFLTYPKGAQILDQKELSWTPTTEQLGFHEIHYRFGTRIDTSFFIYVNDPPVINSKPVENVGVGHQYAYQILSFDNNEDAVIEFFLKEGPAGINIDNYGLLLWYPTETQLDYQRITVAISDGYNIANQSFDIYVNSLPTILDNPAPIAIINKKYSGKLAFEDKNTPNQARVSVVKGPKDLLLEENGALSWTPNEHQIGFHDIVYELKDVYTSQIDSFTLYVNSPPVITSTPNSNAKVAIPWRYTARVEDKNDNQDISFIIHNSTIPELNISRKGSITWTPSDAYLDKQTFTISVSDGIQDVLQEINLFVNSTPIIHPVTDTLAVTNVQYYATIKVTEKNADQKLIYTLSQAPSGMAISHQGVITWTPDDLESGYHEIFFAVEDGLEKVKSSFKIYVNAPPEFISLPKELTIVNEEYRYAINVQDRNREQALNVKIDRAPKGVTLVDNTLIWTPSIEYLNTQLITLSVSDGSLVETQDISLFVNALPEVYSEPKVAVISEQFYTYTLTTRDANGDTFSYKTVFLPPGATFDETTATLNWTPTPEQEGNNEVIIKITDSHNQSTLHKYNLYVFEPPEKKGFFSRMFGG